MNDNDIFREIAAQLRPSPEVRAALATRIDAQPTASTPEPAPEPPVRRHRRLPAWGAAVAAVALAVAAASMPGLLGREVGSSDRSPGLSVASPHGSRYVGGSGDYAPVCGAVTAAPLQNPWEISYPMSFAAGQGQADIAVGLQSDSWDTNVQVEGIDEGDLVKSDGRTIFIASGSTVRLVSADGAGSRELSRIETSELAVANTDGTVQGAVSDLMLHGTTLVALVTDFTPRLEAGTPNHRPFGFTPYLARETKALVYDVSDPAAPRFLTWLGQSGAPVSSRLSGDIVYLVTSYMVDDADAVRADDPSTFVPLVSDALGTAPLNAADIMLMPEPQAAAFTVISSIDLTDRQRIDAQTVFGGAQDVYLTRDSLFLTSPSHVTSPITDFPDTRTPFTSVAATTDLTRIALDDGQLTAAAQARIPGTVLNQFALDEFGSHLRVAVTMTGPTASGWLTSPALLVLDQTLETVGMLPQLAVNESIQSVRFSGPTAYVVSFRQVDPLFAIDLSDPTAPAIMSELKIPGFSTYLHPWSDGLLLGLGIDGTETGPTSDLKLTMFDTSDPFDVTETATLKVPLNQAEALRNHKAVLIDEKSGLIGFAASSYDADATGVHYLVYRWDDGAFSLVEDLSVDRVTRDQMTGQVQGVRGLTVGNHLYVASGSGVDVYAADSAPGGGLVRVAVERFDGR